MFNYKPDAVIYQTVTKIFVKQKKQLTVCKPSQQEANGDLFRASASEQIVISVLRKQHFMKRKGGELVSKLKPQYQTKDSEAVSLPPSLSDRRRGFGL